MKLRSLAILCIGVICFSCKQTSTKVDTIENDKEQIKTVMIQALKWHDTNGPFAGFEPIFRSGEKNAVGMDLKQLETALDKFEKTNYFDKEFIDNYRKIVEKIDEQIKAKKLIFAEDEIPPYGGADLWCNCQDLPVDHSWDKIVFDFVSVEKDRADFSWTWGNPEWSKGFIYKVMAKKVDGTWKISYMEGFDYNEMTKIN